MSHIFWRGDAVAVAQVRTVQLTAYDAATTYTITIGTKTVSVVGTGGSTTTAATALAAALNASTIPEFAEVTWSSSTSYIIGTADTAGKPFTFTASVTGGTGTVGSVSDTTPNAGPNVWAAANFSGGVAPGAGDDVWFKDNAVSVLYGLDQSAVAALGSLNFLATYTGLVGLPLMNTDGTLSYYEYRPRSLIHKTDVLKIGDGQGTGSGRIRVNVLAANDTVITVFSTGQSVDPNARAVHIIGGDSASLLTVLSGSVDVALDGGSTAEFATITTQRNADVRISSGVTVATLNAWGQSKVIIDCAATTITQRDGSTVKKGAGNVTTVLLEAGCTLDLQAALTVTALTAQGGSVLNLENGAGTVTLTDSTFYATATINDKVGRLVFTNDYAAPNGAHTVNHFTKAGVVVDVT